MLYVFLGTEFASPGSVRHLYCSVSPCAFLGVQSYLLELWFWSSIVASLVAEDLEYFDQAVGMVCPIGLRPPVPG